MLKNPFGERDGKIIMISQIKPEERGARCNCVCPLCRGKFEAVLGKGPSVSFTPYFRHDGEPCNTTKMLMTAFYRLLCEAIEEKQEFRYPDCFGFLVGDSTIDEKISLSAKDHDGYERIIESDAFTVERYELHINKKEVPDALLLEHKGHTLAVVITPPATICKIPKAKPFKEFPTVSIDMNDKMGILDKSMDLEHIWAAELKTRLRDGIDGKEWLNSPKINKWEERKKAELEEQRRKQREEEEKRREEALKQRDETIQYLKELEAKVQSEQKNAPKMASRYSIHTEEMRKACSPSRKFFCKGCHEWKDSSEMVEYGGKGDDENKGLCRACYLANHNIKR